MTRSRVEGLLLANRFVAYVFDDMHTRFGDLAQARAAAVKHLAETLKGAGSGGGLYHLRAERCSISPTIGTSCRKR